MVEQLNYFVEVLESSTNADISTK